MTNSFIRFGGYCAMLTGVFSILYAVFFLVIAKQAAYVGTLGSWVILAASGIFSSAAYVGLYERIVEKEDDGFGLWALLLGVLASFATLLHGAFQATTIYGRGAVDSALGAPSQIDPAGLAAFGLVGLVSLLFGGLILRTGALPRPLGYVGVFNSILLVVLYLATLFNWLPVILLSGGLTSVVVGPLWWIWLGRELVGTHLSMPARMGTLETGYGK